MSEPTTSLPPFSEETERAVIGCALIDALNAVNVIRGRFKLDAEAFYLPPHQTVMRTILAMVDAGKHADLLTVTQRMRDDGTLEEAGGEAMLERCVDSGAFESAIPAYCEILRDKWWARKLRATLQDAREAIVAAQKPADQLCGEYAAKIGDIVLQESNAPANVEVFDREADRVQMAHDRRQGGEDVPWPGLETPFGRLNELLGGLQPGLHVLAGRPSAGKTSLEGEISDYVSLSAGHVLRVYMDDTHQGAIRRFMARHSGVSLSKMLHGFARNDQIKRMREDVRNLLSQAKFSVIDNETNLSAICTAARAAKRKHDIKLLTIDYAQLVKTGDKYIDSDPRMRVLETTGRLKALWKELNIPILLLSQLNRGSEMEDREPRLSDLKEGGTLEEDASSVMIAWRDKNEPERPIDATGHNFKYPVALSVLKNKDGAQGLVPLWFFKSYFKFVQTRRVRKGGLDQYLGWQEDWTAEQGGQ